MIIRELFTRMGLKVDDKSFRKADKGIANTASKLRQLGGLLVGGVVARGISNFISSQINLGDNIGKTAVQIGVGVEALQELRFAADLAGVEAAQFDQALALLQKNAAEAADGSKEFADEFLRLGVNVKDASGELKNGEQLLADVADGIFALDNDSQKTATSLALMGRAGRRLLPLFLNGAKGIEEMRQEARDLGFILGVEDVKASELARDELTRFGRVVQGMKSRVFLAVLPTIINFTGGLIKMGRQFNESLKGTKLVQAALLLLGVAAGAAAIKLVIAFAPALLTFLGIALAVGLLVIIVDELLTLFAGGESVVGRFLDEVFGIGTAQQFVDDFRIGIELMTEAWDDAEGSVFDFFATLLGFESDITHIGDLMFNLGQTTFEAWQKISDAIVDNAERIGDAIGRLFGGQLGALIGAQVGKLLASTKEERAERTFERTRADRRGIAGEASGQTRQSIRRIQADNRLVARKRERTIRRAARTAAKAGRAEATKARREGKIRKAERLEAGVAGFEREAGLRVAGTLGGTGIGRATARGIAGGVEETRFGRARAPRTPVAVQQDNTVNLTVNAAPGDDTTALVAKVRALIDDRDAKNRRAVGDALQQTGG